MDFKIRELTAQDQSLYADLLGSHKNTWAHDASTTDPLERSQMILTSPHMRVFAAQSEANGSLKMSITARRWTAMPVYTLIDFKSIDTFTVGSFKTAFEPLIRELVLAMEQEKRFEFWYLIEDKGVYASRSKRQGRNIMQYVVEHLSRYSIFDEARFQAGELPEWPLYASMLGDRPAKVPTVLRRAIHQHKLAGN